MFVLAVDHFGLIGMKLQSTVIQSIRKSLLEVMRLLEAAAMYQSVVCVSAKRQFREIRHHPPVECIVQKQIGEQRGDNASVMRFLNRIVLFASR